MVQGWSLGMLFLLFAVAGPTFYIPQNRDTITPAVTLDLKISRLQRRGGELEDKEDNLRLAIGCGSIRYQQPQAEQTAMARPH